MNTQRRVMIAMVTVALIAFTTQGIAMAKVVKAERYRAPQINAEAVVLGPMTGEEGATRFEPRSIGPLCSSPRPTEVRLYSRSARG